MRRGGSIRGGARDGRVRTGRAAVRPRCGQLSTHPGLSHETAVGRLASMGRQNVGKECIRVGTSVLQECEMGGRWIEQQSAVGAALLELLL